MDGLKENSNCKSSSQEENFERTEICTATECIYTRWVKPVSVRELMFVSNDVLLIHIGKTLIFYNVRTKKEDFLVVGGNKSTPSGGENIPIDGIGCVDCCDIGLLALAEQPPIAKVAICRYPDLKVLATLIDNNNSATYKSILFLRLEYLIGLRDYPAFDLIVWAWRIQEKLLVVNTGFIQPNQSLNLSAIGRDVYLSQIERDVKCKLQLWTVFISCKTVYTERTQVELPTDMDIVTGCWTLSGWFVFCDSSMNVYRAQPRVPKPEICIENTEDKCDPYALICPIKQGFILYKDNSLTDIKGVFTKNWTLVVNHSLQSMIARENDVYGWSNEGVLLELTQNKEQISKIYGTSIKYFTFIKPTDETIATINDKNVLQVWNVFNGELKNEIKLSGMATCLCSNPFFYYIAISFKNGKVELLKTDPKVNDLELISKIVLCDEELSLVNFFSDGKRCLVSSFSIGQFYCVNIELGKVCSVTSKYRLEKEVIDIEIFDNNTSKSSFVIVLYKNQETFELAGNNIVILDTEFNTIFELKDQQFYYTSIFKWISFDIPQIISVAFIVMFSRCIHLMIINIILKNILDLKVISLDHNLRSIKASVGENHCVTFSYDGTYNLYEFYDECQWKKIVMVNCSHWQTGGLIAAQVDSNAHNILTLSYQGNFMCTSFKDSCIYTRRFSQTNIPISIDNMKTEGIGFEEELEMQKRMTWEMINDKIELDASKIAYSEQKNEIIQEFEQIKKELLILLEKNTNESEDTKIGIEEFDLNVDYRLEFKEKCKIERHEYKAKIISDINKFKMDTKNILKEHWESLFVKPKCICSFKKLYKVDNYPISIKDQEIITKTNQIIEKRISMKNKEKYMCKTSEEMVFSKDNLNVLDGEIMLNQIREKNDELLMGSISHRFVDVVEQLNYQENYYKLEMVNDEIVLLQFMINKLKHKFNNFFDEMFTSKQHQIDNLKGYNDRLRVIESEFRLACKIEPSEPSPIDYEWNQYEQTEKLTRVEDDELPKSVHNILLSNNQMIFDTNSVNKETDTQSLASDNFRRQALDNIMDGVLEKRWEDELKKDVPKPKCMLKKSVSEYTDDDFEAIKEYEELVETKNNDRMKYKKILEEEKTMIIQLIDDNINEFDNNIFKLFHIKLKYNLAISQEKLKIIRLSKMLSDSNLREQKIKIYEKSILEIEKTIVDMTKNIVKTEATYNILLNTIQTLKHKNNVLNKRFKAEFPSKLIYEQALIAFNRRPKIQGNKNYSSLLGYQFVSSIIDPNDDKLDLLCSEFVKYLDTLKIYDDYKYVEDYKLNMDRETWYKVCNFRRIKIESEFKISAYQKEATDKANLLDNLIREKEDKETTIEKFKTLITKLQNENISYKNDPETQLVIKRGNIEIEQTGHLEDFKSVVLINKDTIEEVNAEIKEMGKIKIGVLSNLLKFKRKCQLLKWKYVILKNHKITLYKYRYDVIKSMKVTNDMLHYLKFKSKGIDIDKHAEQKVDNELAAIQVSCSRERKKCVQRLDELIDKIRSVKKENDKTDKNIDEMNTHLTELKNKIDHSIADKFKCISDLRMKNIVKRAQMISNVQELHKEVFMLQTELELLLLKTFPTLYNTPKSISIRK